MKRSVPLVVLASAGVFLSLPVATGQAPTDESDAYLRWTPSQAESVGKARYVKGRVGELFDSRMLKTERAYNYKLAATWLTPEVIRATARLKQLRNRLTDEQTRALVAEAEAVGDTVVMVELDPREGSGVVPLDWIALLHPKEVQPEAGNSVVGVNKPELRHLDALQGVLRRNYDYDRFWVVFSLVTQKGKPLFPDRSSEAELVVRVYDKQGKVRWRIPSSIRQRQLRHQQR